MGDALIENSQRIKDSLETDSSYDGDYNED